MIKIIVLLLGLLWAAHPALSQTIGITSVETWTNGAYEYVNIKTTGWAPPFHKYYKDRNRLVLTFIDTKIDFIPGFITTKESRIADILTVSTGTNPPSTEVVINFKRDVRYDVANMMGRNACLIEICDAPAPAEGDEREASLEAGVEALPEVPSFARTGKFKVILAGHEFKTGGKNIFSGGQYMVPAKDFFEAIDAQVIERKNGHLLVMRGDAQKIEVGPGSKRVKVNGKDFSLDVEPKAIARGRRIVLYVPLVSIARIIDYGVIWDEGAKSLVINPILKNITLSSSGPQSKVELTFSAPIDDKNISLLSASKLITIEARDVIVVGDKRRVISGEAAIIRKIHVAQGDPRTTLITIALSSDKPFRETLLDHGNAYSIIFSHAITGIRSVKGPGMTLVEISSDSPVTFEVSEAKNPERIILDIPQAILKSPSRISVPQSSLETISAVAASQFRLDPPAVRVVISLSEASKFATHLSDDGRKISISIMNSKTAKKPVAPKKFSILKNKIVIVDAGHGGRDPGTIGYSGTYEKNATLLLSLKIAEALERAGATVLLTRDSDTTPDMRDIARFANGNRADIFIAVHYNSFPWQGVSGTETYYYTPQSRLLARVVHRNLVNGIHRKNRGIKRVMYYTIHHTTMPSILIEPGYLTNAKEEKLAFSAVFQRQVASDILKGVVEYFNALGKMKRGKG